MIKHLLMFKLKEEADGKSKAQNAAELKTKIEALKDAIKEINTIEIGINTSKSDRAWDASLYSEFDSFEDLTVYRNHPDHRKVVDFVNLVCEDRIVVDYEK